MARLIAPRIHLVDQQKSQQTCGCPFGTIPRQVAWGTYKSDPNTHFYLCEFVDMIEELPDIQKFCAMLAKFHHDSMVDKDAPKEFGFHTMTDEGSMYQDISWCKSWEEMYTRRFQSFVDQELVSQGPSEKLDEVLLQFIHKVIPRLLRPLGTNDRVLRPVALHGDIWYGNLLPMQPQESLRTSIHQFSGDTMNVSGFHVPLSRIDCAPSSCLNDLRSMATPRYRLGRHWMEEYHKFFPISPPEEDYEDRNLLYGM